MTVHLATEHFVNPMRRRFTIPSGLSQEAFLIDLAEALAGFSQHQLAEAAGWFRDNREVRAFPTVAEARRTCGRFPKSPVAILAPKERDWKTAEERRSEDIAARMRRKTAAAMCATALGREADRDGWLVAMVEFAEDHGHPPESSSEIAACKAKARRSEDGLARARGFEFFGALVNLRQAMLDRAHRDVFEAKHA